MTPRATAPLLGVGRRALRLQSDERLVRLFRDGHEEAFEEIFRRYRAPLVAFACRFVAFHRAEDVVQTAMANAQRALQREGQVLALRSWLFKIVRNVALNEIRDEPRTEELDPDFDGVPQPPEIAESRERFDSLVTAICALPESQRRALVLRELEGAGHEEIAAGLGTTPTAVRGLIFRARTRLRDAAGALIPLPLLGLLLESGAGSAASAAAAGSSSSVLPGSSVAGAAAAGSGLKVVAIGAAIVAIGTGATVQMAGGPGGEPGQAEASAAPTGELQTNSRRGGELPVRFSDPEREADRDKQSRRDGGDRGERARDDGRTRPASGTPSAGTEHSSDSDEEARDRAEDAADEARDQAEDEQDAREDAAEEAAELEEEAADRLEDALEEAAERERESDD